MEPSQRILVVSPMPLLPPTGGAQRRIAALVEQLQALGHAVHFAHIERDPGDAEAMRAALGERFHRIPYQPLCHEHSLLPRCARRAWRLLRSERAWLYGVDSQFDRGVLPRLRRLQEHHRFSTVIVEYVFQSRALEAFGPGVRKLIDTHDVWTHRHRLYLAQGRAPDWYSMRPEQEALGLARSHGVIAIQDAEASQLAQITPRPIYTVGHFVKIGEAPAEPGDGVDLLFIGGRNEANVHGLVWFREHVWPRLLARGHRMRLLVAGPVCDHSLPAEGIVHLGALDDAGLERAYRFASVAINPVLTGTGLSIKAAEAMGHGLPVVATRAGGRGMEAAIGQGLSVADDPEAFASEIDRIAGSRQCRRSLSEAARRFAVGWNDRQRRALVTALECPC